MKIAVQFLAVSTIVSIAPGLSATPEPADPPVLFVGKTLFEAGISSKSVLHTNRTGGSAGSGVAPIPGAIETMVETARNWAAIFMLDTP